LEIVSDPQDVANSGEQAQRLTNEMLRFRCLAFAEGDGRKVSKARCNAVQVAIGAIDGQGRLEMLPGLREVALIDGEDPQVAEDRGQPFRRPDLTPDLETLEQELNPLVNTWTGAAQQAYHEKKQQWDTAAANLAQVLNEIGRAVGQANENYQAAEQANRNAWS